MAVLWAFATVLTLVGWDLFPDQAWQILYAYVFVSAALAMRTLVKALAAAHPTWGWTDFDRALQQRPRPVVRPAGLEDVERAVRFGQWRALDAHVRLRPLLREAADAHLTAQYGRGLDAPPEVVRAHLGERVWEAVRPREEPRDRDAPGMLLEELAAILTILEELQRR